MTNHQQNSTELPEGLLDLLRKVDTPTVCNAIEVVEGRRGFDRFTKGTMQHSKPGYPPMVGFARTAKIASLVPSIESVDTIKERRIEYFRSMASGAKPSIAVIEDIDHPNCIGAWWGEVHVAIHKGFGMKGVVTNGAMRDLDVIDQDFPILAGSVSVSHFHVRVEELGLPVNIHGMQVEQGDLIHADRHGALHIPIEVFDELKSAIETVIRNEKIVLGPAQEDGFTIEKLEEAWAEFERVRT